MRRADPPGVRYPARLLAVAAILSLLTTTGHVTRVAAAAPAPTATVVQGGLVIPWDVAFTPDGQMLVTERPGRVRVYAGGYQNAALLRTVSIPGMHAAGEAGLLGITVDVNYAVNRFVYVCASRDIGGQWLNQVLRYRVADNLAWTDGQVLLSGMLAASNHNGCPLEMDVSGRLWIGMGDAGVAMRAQDPNSLNGKILRINRDGSIPADNPILPGAASRTAAYSMGHRNPQGIAFRPGTGEVYAAEHGPDRDDEVNLIVAGGNYGWPCYTGAGNAYVSDASCGPASAYRDSLWASGFPTIATSNLAFADGGPWSDWDGHLFVATLKQSDLRRFTVGSSSVSQAQVLYDGTWGRLRAVVRGPGGQLFLTTSNGSNDRVIRIAAATPVVNRIAGVDRYATAAAISAATSPPGVPVAYVANGGAFPDALTGAAAAAHLGGPLLLVTRTTIPSSTAGELSRLRPGRIVVVGDGNVISSGVMAALGAYTSGSVTRAAGPDRYATAAAVSAGAFAPGVSRAYVATGLVFADAVAGAPAAAHFGGPMLLVRPDRIPAAVAAELARLKPQQIVVLGGTPSVSEAVRSALGAYASSGVARIGGADRYETAALLAASVWDAADHVYIASGYTFPDGLSGGAAAGREDVPLLLVRPTAVPSTTGQAIIRLHPFRLTVLGGTPSVSASVASHLRDLLAGSP